MCLHCFTIRLSLRGHPVSNTMFVALNSLPRAQESSPTHHYSLIRSHSVSNITVLHWIAFLEPMCHHSSITHTLITLIRGQPVFNITVLHWMILQKPLCHHLLINHSLIKGHPDSNTTSLLWMAIQEPRCHHWYITHPLFLMSFCFKNHIPFKSTCAITQSIIHHI